MTIFTASWFTKLPPGHTRVRISRGAARGQSGYKTYSALAPGKWFNSVSPPEYLTLYNAILDKLDPRRVVAELEALGPNPTMLCFEAPKDIDAGFKWCHRNIAAQWLEDSIGVTVAEVNWPTLKRFAFLRSQHMQPPSYEPRSPENLMDVLAEKSS